MVERYGRGKTETLRKDPVRVPLCTKTLREMLAVSYCCALPLPCEHRSHCADVWHCRSVSEIAGSSLADGMDVRLLCVLRD